MEGKYSSGDVGFCKRAGHTGGVEISWEDDTVVGVTCGYYGDYRTCKFAATCELYNRRPVGFVQTYPNDLRNKSSE